MRRFQLTEATLLDELLSKLLVTSALERSEDGPALPSWPSSVIVVGSSCAGKTTLVDAVRQAQLGGVFVATRYITRPRRKNDSCEENVHIDDQAFDERRAQGEIEWCWSRPMHGERVVRYGFSACPPGILPVYSANNALFRNRASVQPSASIGNALWVGVPTPLAVRRERMQERSTDLSEREREFRLADLAEDMPSQVHLLAHSHGETSELAKLQMRSLVAALRGKA